MSSRSSQTFRLLLDIAKEAIFAVDGTFMRFAVLRRLRGLSDLEVPSIGREVRIPSGSRALAGWFVLPEGPVLASVLLFHGIGDRILYWRRAQQRLARSGVASLVFHYSGYPGSEGASTPENLDQDARSAYTWLRAKVPAVPVFLLGFSLGSGLAAEVAGSLEPPPAGLILAEAFTTLRLAASRVVGPLNFIARLFPDVWKTGENVGSLKLPVLVVHSTGDALFPVAMAEEIFAAAQAGGAPAELILLDGHRHNAPYWTVPEDYWTAILDFIARTSKTQTGPRERP